MMVAVAGGDTDEGAVSRWRPRRQRRLPLLVLGALLVASSTFGFVLWTMQQTERVPVLVAASTIEAGQEVSRADVELVPVGIDDRLAVLGLESMEMVVGARARRQIPQGTPISESLLIGSGAVVEPGMAVVGAVLAPGEYPTSLLGPGDRVRFVRVGDSLASATPADAPAGPDPEAVLGDGVVRSRVEVDEAGFSRDLFLSFVVPQEMAVAVADAAAANQLRVVLVGAEEASQ